MDIPILLAVEDDFALDPFNPTLVYNIKGGEGVGSGSIRRYESAGQVFKKRPACVGQGIWWDVVWRRARVSGPSGLLVLSVVLDRCRSLPLSHVSCMLVWIVRESVLTISLIGFSCYSVLDTQCELLYKTSATFPEEMSTMLQNTSICLKAGQRPALGRTRTLVGPYHCIRLLPDQTNSKRGTRKTSRENAVLGPTCDPDGLINIVTGKES